MQIISANGQQTSVMEQTLRSIACYRSLYSCLATRWRRPPTRLFALHELRDEVLIVKHFSAPDSALLYLDIQFNSKSRQFLRGQWIKEVQDNASRHRDADARRPQPLSHHLGNQQPRLQRSIYPVFDIDYGTDISSLPHGVVHAVPAT
jgi:hypothetical protein